mmetsp:Transcript_124575/g.265685  ORF Transcript_124575/g.265685 Transcript_124575/m.265685 type:complete len:96 (-) Transcript_124575:1177-1464(-)
MKMSVSRKWEAVAAIEVRFAGITELSTGSESPGRRSGPKSILTSLRTLYASQLKMLAAFANCVLIKVDSEPAALTTEKQNKDWYGDGVPVVVEVL